MPSTPIGPHPWNWAGMLGPVSAIQLRSRRPNYPARLNFVGKKSVNQGTNATNKMPMTNTIR